MQSIFRPTRQARSAFLAEAASSNGLNRRDIVAGACACGVGALIGPSQSARSQLKLWLRRRVRSTNDWTQPQPLSKQE
jgi:hypothetical protein